MALSRKKKIIIGAAAAVLAPVRADTAALRHKIDSIADAHAGSWIMPIANAEVG